MTAFVTACPDVVLIVNATGVPAVVVCGAAVTLSPDRPAAPTLVVELLLPDVAVTVAAAVEVRIVRAMPLASVIAVVGETVPAFVLNVTGAPGTASPPTVSTRACTSVEPPLAGSVWVVADNAMRSAAADPTS